MNCIVTNRDLRLVYVSHENGSVPFFVKRIFFAGMFIYACVYVRASACACYIYAPLVNNIYCLKYSILLSMHMFDQVPSCRASGCSLSGVARGRLSSDRLPGQRLPARCGSSSTWCRSPARRPFGAPRGAAGPAGGRPRSCRQNRPHHSCIRTYSDITRDRPAVD